VSDVLDRVAKLLELADRAGTEHEAANAAARAAELMAKHQITILDVQSRGVESEPGVEEGRLDSDDESAGPSRVENWHRRLLSAVCAAFGGRPWMCGRSRMQEMRMVGPPGSVATARYMYLWLERQIRHMAREAARRHGETNAWRRSYALGVVTRVHVRLQEGRRAGQVGAWSQAMFLVDRQQAAIHDRMSTMGLRQARAGVRRRPDATSWGFHDGADVELGESEARRLADAPKRLK